MKYISFNFRTNLYASFIFLILVVYTTIFFHVLEDMIMGYKAVTPSLIYASVLLPVIITALNFKKTFFLFLTNLKMLLLFIVLFYTGLSIFWGTSVALGVDAWLKLSIPVVLISSIYARNHLHEACIRSFKAYFIFIAVFNIIFLLFLPSYGTGGGTAINGVFIDRNYACYFTNHALAYFLYTFLFYNKKRIFNICMAALCFLYIAISGSATGLITSIIVTALVFIVPSISKNKRLFLPMMIISALLFISSSLTSIYFKSEILELLGKDETLTGRTNIWSVILDAAKERPIFGYGAEKFLIANDGMVIPATNDYERDWRYMELETHNTYLTFLLNFGALGLSLFVIAYCIMFLGLAKSLYLQSGEGNWVNLNVIFMVIGLIFQITLEMYSALGFWIIFTYLYISSVYNKGEAPKIY